MEGEAILGVEYLCGLEMDLLANGKQLGLYMGVVVACRPCERVCGFANEAEIVDLLSNLEGQAEKGREWRQRRCFYSCCSQTR